jgi:hypothetical protein
MPQQAEHATRKGRYNKKIEVTVTAGNRQEGTLT